MKMQVQGQLGGLGRGQAEASEEGFIQDLCLGLGTLRWQQEALAQDGAHSTGIGMVPKHWAEL